MTAEQQGSDESGEGLTTDGQANDCTHGSATGIDTTPISDPSKVWRCDHCGLRWSDATPLVSADRAAAAESSADAGWTKYEVECDTTDVLRTRAESAEAALATARRDADELRAEVERLEDESGQRFASANMLHAKWQDAERDKVHAVHVTAEPVAEDVVWCEECEEWVTAGAPEPRAALANPSAAQGEVEHRTPGVYGFGDPKRWIDDASTDAPEASQ